MEICTGAGEKYEEEEGAEGNCYELTTSAILHLPVPLRGGEESME